MYSFIWPIDRTLSGATTLGQSGPGSDGNEEGHYWNLSIRLFSVISRTHVRGGGGLTPQQMCSQCILQAQPTRQTTWEFTTYSKAGSLVTLQRAHYTQTLAHFCERLVTSLYRIWNIIIDIVFSQNMERHAWYYL